LAGTSVRAAACHLAAAAFRDNFKPSSLHVTNGAGLLPSFTALFTALNNIGDPPNRQRAITPKFLRYLHRLGSPGTPTACAIDHVINLLIAGFFFATRPCEIVKTKTPGRTKTLELRDLVFRDWRRKIIPHSALNLHLVAELVTVTWRNQFNGNRMDSCTQRGTRYPLLCPCVRLARCVTRVLTTVPGAAPHSILCSLSNTTTNTTTYIHDEFTLNLLRITCTMFGGKTTFGFNPHEIGNQSIRSGAAMALFLRDHSTTKIMILGRWSSDTFLVYIRPQVLEWTNNMSRDMMSFESFHDVGLYDITSAHDSCTCRKTIHLNGRHSTMQMPNFRLQD
jgi:hypothetical protein